MLTLKQDPRLSACVKKYGMLAAIKLLVSKGRSKGVEEIECEDKLDKNISFVDLTPIDNADKSGHYSKALSFALNSERVKNIALTGPYGSGKSSIIKTFQRRYKDNHQYLNISLAAFKEEVESNGSATQDDVEKEERQTRLIERSILQQMLYGADADKLPYSRFRRISKPTAPFLTASILSSWLVLGYALSKNNALLWKLNISSWKWWMLCVCALVFFALTMKVVEAIYKVSFRTPLKKISLSKAELETSDLPEGSILNKHLDEIIYFFQETDYNVVIIEDLDRFGSPEIFVKLREINKLVNDNNKSQGVIKFLYALKDDMFIHKDRTKFFDFIIPVVPVINSTNSLEKIEARIKNKPYEKGIDEQFLREVSFLLDDMRLIHNTFNEFSIYYEKLHSESLNLTKLLAMMIYKNAYPADFESLHHGKGALFELSDKRLELLNQKKIGLKKKLRTLKVSLQRADGEKGRSIQELMDAYVGHIVRHSTKPVLGFVVKNKFMKFSEITSFEQFEPLLEEGNLTLSTNGQVHTSYNSNQNKISIGKSFQDIEYEINPGETFIERKENINNKQQPQRFKIQEEIQRIEKIISHLPLQKISQFFQDDNTLFDSITKKNSITDSRLLSFFVKNGFLDDTYYLYISKFYEGRMTKKDHEFIVSIRNFIVPAVDQPIDTPEEVCANMREEDFGHKYVLNVFLIDYLLEFSDENAKRLQSALQFISENFEEASDFFSAYFVSGKHLERLISRLSVEWPSLIDASCESPMADEIISYILRFVDAKHISLKMNSTSTLTDYLNKFGHHIFVSALVAPSQYDVLKELNVRFQSLAELDNNSGVIDFSYNNNLYTITSENIVYLMNRFQEKLQVSIKEIYTANYTALLIAKETVIKAYVERNIVVYVENVLLSLSGNKCESQKSILALLKNEELGVEQKKKIILSQAHVFETFDAIPIDLWECLFENEKIVVSWGNVSSFHESESVDSTFLSQYIQDNSQALSRKKIPIDVLGDEQAKSLSRFLIGNEKIDIYSYGSILKAIPYQYIDFPDISSLDRLLLLAKKKVVILSENSFDFSKIHPTLKTALIENNFSKYSKEKDEFSINDEIQELLLKGTLNSQQKIEICHDVTPDEVVSNPALAQLISGILSPNSIDCKNIHQQILVSAIENAKTISDALRLLIKGIVLWDEANTMAVLKKLIKPYSEIASYGKRPMLENNELNKALTRALKSNNFISSVKVSSTGIRINTWRSENRE